MHQPSRIRERAIQQARGVVVHALLLHLRTHRLHTSIANSLSDGLPQPSSGREAMVGGSRDNSFNFLSAAQRHSRPSDHLQLFPVILLYLSVSRYAHRAMGAVYCDVPTKTLKYSFAFFLLFVVHPIYYLRPSILSLLVVTQIRSYIAGSSPRLPTTVRALHFYRENISAFSSLINSRRIVLTHAGRSRQ